MEKLTRKQKNVLTYIKEYMSKHSYPPTIREICKGLELNSPATVHVHLQKLIDKGYIQKGDSQNRSLELLVENEFIKKDGSIISVPLLGKVAAGNPIEAIERAEEKITLPAYLIPARKEVFTLEVNGDSMINVGIYDGDMVIVERCNTAKNGEIVVAMNDENEVTLKTFYKEDGYFRLQPENDFMAPIILDSVTILGKAIGLYRKF